MREEEAGGGRRPGQAGGRRPGGRRLGLKKCRNEGGG